MVPIVFATDHNFVMPTCVTITSLLATSQKEYFSIHVIVGEDVTNADRELMEQVVRKNSSSSQISFLEIGATFEDGYEIRGISKACYNRLMIPWLLPQYDKVIYSDVDIIFKGDISEIFSLDLGEKLVAGVGGEVWGKGKVGQYIHKLGIDPKGYINSGFLLINSALQRKNNLKEEYLKLSKKKYIYQDQDIINLVCSGKTLLLPSNFNIKPSDVVKYRPDEVKVIHYIGLKPWQYFTYCWNDWWEVYSGSEVYDRNLNYEISRKILDPVARVKLVRKLLMGKFKLYMRLMGVSQ